MIATPTEWVRVSRHNPCPVCTKPDWCLASEDGSVAICARIESEKRAGDAGWLHDLGGKPLPMPPTPALRETKQLRRAPIERRHAIYTALLGVLPLTPGHREHLEGRGLTEAGVTALQYRTLPQDGRRAVVRELQERDLKLAGVPGFYLHHGEVCLSGAPGILLPVRDTEGRIQALQVRADHAESGGKYRWLSSAGKHMGSSPGAPVHVSRPADTHTSEVWVTEGPLKADITVLRLGRCVLAVAGVGNWQGVIPIVRQLQPDRIVVAFDQDKNGNQAVRAYLDALTACLIRHGIRTFEADWNANFKGIDDLLTGGPCPR